MAAGYGAIASGGAATTRRSPALPIVALALCAMAVVAATVSLAQVLCPVLFSLFKKTKNKTNSILEDTYARITMMPRSPTP